MSKVDKRVKNARLAVERATTPEAALVGPPNPGTEGRAQ